MKKLIIGLLSLVFMLVMVRTALAYSFTDAQDVNDGTVGQLEVEVAEDGDWMVWTFDFPVELFTGEGNLNVGLIIATNGEGNGPAYQIHNTDSNTQTFIDGTPVLAGTWVMSPFDTGLNSGCNWLGWHSCQNTLVTDLDWVQAIGHRNTPWEGLVSGDGVMEIRIKKSVLGESFHWAASPTVGSGFWAPASDITMQIPVGFGWGTPLVNMTVPNYVYVPPPPDTTAPIITLEGSNYCGVIALKAVCNETCDYINFWWRAESEAYGEYRYHYVHENEMVFEWDLNTLGAQRANNTTYIMTDGVYYLYAAGKDLAGNWARTPEIQVVVENTTKRSILMCNGVPGKGLESAPGLQKPFNPNSKAAKNAGKK